MTEKGGFHDWFRSCGSPRDRSYGRFHCQDQYSHVAEVVARPMSSLRPQQDEENYLDLLNSDFGYRAWSLLSNGDLSDNF